MRYINLASNRKITNDTLILLMGLFYPAINNYIWRVLVGFTSIFGVYFSIQVFDSIVWTCIIAYIISTIQNPTINKKTLSIYAFLVSITLLSFALTSYDYFSVSVLITMLIGTFSFFLQGSLINIKRVSHKQLYIVAIATLCVSIVYSLYSVGLKEIDLEDNMDFAYKILPSVLIIVSWLFTNQKKKLAIVFTVIGSVFLLLQGTRGPLLCLAVFVCLMLYKKFGIGKVFLGVGSVVLITALVFSSQHIQIKLLELSEKIDSSGYSSRFLTMMLKGELSADNGRDAIQDFLIKAIRDNPLRIRGMYADRQATQGLVDYEYSTNYMYGTYAHSLWLELIYNWGIIGGISVLSLISFGVLNLIKRSNQNDAYIVMIFICMGFVHLFLSGSYLQNANFFFLIGLAVNYYEKKGSFTKERLG